MQQRTGRQARDGGGTFAHREDQLPVGLTVSAALRPTWTLPDEDLTKTHEDLTKT